MDLIFETSRGTVFAIEVGYFDTVSEIKEKVQKYRGIPAFKQTLIFNKQVLHDELNIHYSDILDRSRIQLIITTEHDEPTLQIEDYLPPSNKFIILFRSPTSKLVVALDMDKNSTVIRLKERIHDKEGVPVSRLVVRADGVELQDQRSLRDYRLSDLSVVEVSVKRLQTSLRTETCPNKLRVMVLTKRGTNKIPVQVNATDNVGELRKELQRLKQRFQFQLPQQGYSFSYKGRVMDEYQSFQRHNVGEGDTLEILDESVRLLC
ncbi:hypothetical protein RJ640_009577 [Escallonia rubra]|uniref:Ubiquitin-like domain-containing protein n=1 Tax=Escallonia rubra TaxID=112253 RepID=A0AA88U6L5_9ASTE|nr:hypothetical protein RJ640_009577 [Escallonia rubra]